MIRNPFKKTKKTRQDDTLFDQELHRIHHMQTASKRLYKSMKRTTEAESSQSKANLKVFNELSMSSCTKVEPLKSTVDCVNGCGNQLQSHYKDHLMVTDVTFIEPMKRFHGLYKQVDIHTKQRENKLQEVERQQGKVEKLQSAQSTLSAKYEMSQRKLSSVKSEYDKINQQLMNEMPKLYEKRLDFFEPCLTALMCSQSLYHQKCAQSLKQSLNQLESYRTSNESLDDVFSQIKSLTIVRDAV